LVFEEISKVYNGPLEIVKSTIDLDFIDEARKALQKKFAIVFMGDY
jgi:hypothetical protein